MADWKWRAYDLKTGVPLGSLEMAEWAHTDTLNDSGSFSATMIGRDDAHRRDELAATRIARSVIVPVRDGVPLFSGIVWASNPPTLAGSGLLSHFDRQPLYTTKQYLTPGTDQHTIIKELVDWVQANGGDIQVDTSQVGPSGVLRIQTWNAWELKIVGEAIRQKGDNLGGYDFDVRTEYLDGVLTRRLRLWTPRRGRAYIDSTVNPTFTVGGRRGNARAVPSIPRDGHDMVTHVYATGEEIDPNTHERLVAQSVRADLGAAGWSRLGTVIDRSDVKVQATLQAHADGYAYLHGAADVDEIVLEVDPDHEKWRWGTWDLGDDCAVNIEPGPGVPWLPDGFREIRRITGHEWTWSSGKGAKLLVHTGKRLGT